MTNKLEAQFQCRHLQEGRRLCEFVNTGGISAEFPIQEEGQSRGTESPERGPVSTRKTDRPHDLRLLSSNWRS